MSYLFDFGEVLICMAPVFLIMAFIFGTLIWNSVPSSTKKKKEKDETPDGH